MNNYVTLGYFPRAGSTKLAKLLSTDPQLCVVPNSNTYGYASKMVECISDDSTDEAVILRAFNAFLESLSGAKEGQTIIDKNRDWFGSSKLLNKINGTSKHILLIRDIRYCLASWEDVFRNNLVYKSQDIVFPPNMETQDLYQRIDSYLLPENRVLGYFVNHMMQIIENCPSVLEADNVIIVRFEDLIADPVAELNRIYGFIGLENKLNTTAPYSDKYEEESLNHFKLPIHKVKSLTFTNQQENLDDFFSPLISNYIIERCSPFYERFYPQVLTGAK